MQTMHADSKQKKIQLGIKAAGAAVFFLPECRRPKTLLLAAPRSMAFLSDIHRKSLSLSFSLCDVA